MMKSFIFNCDDFIPDDKGGTFICGHRKFALVISSSELSCQILRHVKGRVSFVEVEYPPSVILALLREGLLLQYNDVLLQTGQMKWIDSLQSRWRQFLRRFELQLKSNSIGLLIFLAIQPLISWLLSDQPRILLNKQITNAIVRPWAWILHPTIVAILAVVNIMWLIVNIRLSELKTISIFDHSTSNLVLVIVLLMGFLIIHELGHAASAHSRLGKCGEIRIRRFFYIIPYLSAHLPDVGTCSRTERIAISASGPVVQISSAILLIIIQPNSNTIRYASELSIMFSIINFLPLRYADGYWILVDLLGGKKPRIVLNWLTARGIDIAYTGGFGLLAVALSIAMIL